MMMKYVMILMMLFGVGEVVAPPPGEILYPAARATGPYLYKDTDTGAQVAIRFPKIDPPASYEALIQLCKTRLGIAFVVSTGEIGPQPISLSKAQIMNWIQQSHLTITYDELSRFRYFTITCKMGRDVTFSIIVSNMSDTVRDTFINGCNMSGVRELTCEKAHITRLTYHIEKLLTAINLS